MLVVSPIQLPVSYMGRAVPGKAFRLDHAYFGMSQNVLNLALTTEF